MAQTVDPNIFDASQMLERELGSQSLGSANLEAATRLLYHSEPLVASLSSPPVVPDTTGGKILTLLWCKTHPMDADLTTVAGHVFDQSPVVRLNALDALTAILDGRGESVDPASLVLAREAIQHAARIEKTPLLSGQLLGVAERLGRTAVPRRRSRARVVANPYTAGPPIRAAKDFFGREGILREIESLVASNGNIRAVVLHGARRTGKTSVLYRIADGALGSGVVPVYVDMQGLAGAPLSSLLRVVTRVAWQALGSEVDYLPSSEPDFMEFREYFDAALSRLGKRSLVLMLDEYEVLQTFLTSGFGAQLQSLLESAPNLFVIFAGSKKLEAISDQTFLDLFDMARYIKITFLDHEDAIRMVTQPPKGQLAFMTGVPERIVQLTNGHPFYTQWLCQNLFDVAHRTGTATLADIDQAVRQCLLNPTAHLVLSWNNLRAGEAAVGSAVALLHEETGGPAEPADITRRLKKEGFPVPLNLPTVQRHLTALTNSDWLVKQKDRTAYRFTMELVRKWVAEERPIASLTEKQQQELASRSASFVQQRAAWLLDLAICVLGIVTFSLIVNRFSPEYEILLTLPMIFAYVFLGLRFGDATVGMKTMRIQVIPARRVGMGVGRVCLAALLYTVRITLASFVVLVLLFNVGAVLGRGDSLSEAVSSMLETWSHPLLLTVAVIVIAAELLDGLMIRRGHRRQGLWDKLAAVLQVPTEALRL